MANVGMDIEAVRSLAAQMTAKADEIDSLAGSLSSQLDTVHWIGHDADAFRSDWQSSYTRELHSVSAALRDASSRATNNAAQQEAASAS